MSTEKKEEKKPEKKSAGLFDYVAKIGIAFWLTGIMGIILAGKKIMPLVALFLLRDKQNFEVYAEIIATVNNVASEGDAYIFAIFTAIATSGIMGAGKDKKEPYELLAEILHENISKRDSKNS